MDGSSMGKAMADGMFAMGCIIFFLGGGVALGLFFLIRWLWQHLSIAWN